VVPDQCFSMGRASSEAFAAGFNYQRWDSWLATRTALAHLAGAPPRPRLLRGVPKATAFAAHRARGDRVCCEAYQRRPRLLRTVSGATAFAAAVPKATAFAAAVPEATAFAARRAAGKGVQSTNRR